MRVQLMCADLRPAAASLSQPLLHELEDLAVSAARSAGKFIVQERPEGLGVLETKSSINDIVTVMDQQSEALLRAQLLSARLARERRASPGSSTRSMEP